MKRLINGIARRMPPAFRRFMNAHGNETVKSIEIVRVPLNRFLAGAIRVFARDPELRPMHLFQIITCIEGTHHFVRVDKDEVVKIVPLTEHDVERVLAAAGKNDVFTVSATRLTLREYFRNAQQTAGASMWEYDISAANCQDFVLACLKGNHLLTPQLAEFVTEEQTKAAKKAVPKSIAHAAKSVTSVIGALRHLTQLLS